MKKSFETPQILEKLCKAYLKSCEDNEELPSKAGACVFFRISKDTYNEYKKKSEYSDSLKDLENHMEKAWINRLASNAPTGAIFYLKNAFGYADKHEADITSKGESITNKAELLELTNKFNEFLKEHS